MTLMCGDAQQTLHEEFFRLHNERRAEAIHNGSEETSIDWGQSACPLAVQTLANRDITSRFLGRCHLWYVDFYYRLNTS